MRIGLTYDLRDDYRALGWSEEATAEFDSLVTIDALDDTLVELGHEVDRIGNLSHLVHRLDRGDRWDLVFNICEGVQGYGREAVVPALLEAWNIPCVFSDPLVLTVALHKATTKRVLRDAGVAVAPFALVESLDQISAVDLRYPLFAKPVAEGTSKGVDIRSRIGNRSQLHDACARLLDEFRQPVLVEEYLPGREFTIGILGTGGRARTLGAMEVEITGGSDDDVYSFTHKENCDELVVYHLATDDEADQARAVALRAWRALGCRDGGRVDVRFDVAGTAVVIEVNPLAGLHPIHSDLPILATKLGISFRSLLSEIVASAQERIPGRVPLPS